MRQTFKAALMAAAITIVPAVQAHAQAIDTIGSRYIPKGHSYDSSNRQLPPLNSYQDEISNGTDLKETEIYKAGRDRAYWDTWMNSTHGTYLGGEPRLAPDY
jgi:hypothetical protein